MVAPGLILAAPSSGSGKTVTTLALLRALRNNGVRVASAKAGPDYIDPAFHAAASGRACFNLDAWGMRAETLSGLVCRLGDDADLILCEGVMGLFDGASGGGGSTADLAALTGWPVVLIVDAKGQGASVAALVEGFAHHRTDIDVAGIICNRVGGPGHERILGNAITSMRRAIPLLGHIPNSTALNLPSRHLGLVQASEHDALDGFLDDAAAVISGHVDLALLQRTAKPSGMAGTESAANLPPLGQRIAIASDAAFRFSYPAVRRGWRESGVAITTFSPLADEAPDANADAVYLPGGYPELHAGRLAANQKFMVGLRRAAAKGAAVFGECGGYMVLGEELVDAEGARHRMAGLLPLATSFAKRKLHLGYRRLETTLSSPLGKSGTRFTGHEFHYASIEQEGPGDHLFNAVDSRGTDLPAAGLVVENVAGSFIHLIDCAT